MPKKYEHVEDGEWTEVDFSEGLSFACCDCALVHDLGVKIEDGKVFLSFTRENRKTAAMRRHHGIPALSRLTPPQ